VTSRPQCVSNFQFARTISYFNTNWRPHVLHIACNRKYKISIGLLCVQQDYGAPSQDLFSIFISLPFNHNALLVSNENTPIFTRINVCLLLHFTVHCYRKSTDWKKFCVMYITNNIRFFLPNTILLVCTQNTYFTKYISNKPISLKKAVTKLAKLIYFAVLGDSK